MFERAKTAFVCAAAIVCHACSGGGAAGPAGTKQLDASADRSQPVLDGGAAHGSDAVGGDAGEGGAACLHPELEPPRGKLGIPTEWVAAPATPAGAGFFIGKTIWAAVDSQGNLVTVRSYSAGPAFVVERRDPSGNVTLEKAFGTGTFVIPGSPYTQPQALGATPDGGIIIAGAFIGTVDFGLGPLTSRPPAGPQPTCGGGCEDGGCPDGGPSNVAAPLPDAQPDLFVLKLNGSGAPLYNLQFGDPYDQEFTSMATDQSGNAVLSGVMTGTVDFGGGPRASVDGPAGFVLKLDSSGHHVFSTLFGQGCDAPSLTQVAADQHGNTVVAYQGTVAVAGMPVQGAGVFELDPTGAIRWVRGGLSPSGIITIAVGGDGSIAVAGTPPATDLGCGPVTSDTGFQTSGFVTALAPDGQTRWARTFNANSMSPLITPFAVTIDATGSVAVGGEIRGDYDLGGGRLTVPPGYAIDAFLAKFDVSGHHVWSGQSAGSDSVNATLWTIVPGSNGSLYGGGSYSGAPDFGTGPLPSTAQELQFVGRFGP